MAQAHDGRTGAERWQDIQARAEARARRRTQVGRCAVAGCDRARMADSTRCPAHSATTADGQAWRRAQDRRRVRLTRRGQVVRGIGRAVMVAAVAWSAWQVAGIVADGAANGVAPACRAGITACAEGATVPDVVTDPPIIVGTGRQGRCVTVDTGRNVATMGRLRYRYRDAGDGLQWQAGTPKHVQALAQAGIDTRRATGAPAAPAIIRTCATWQVPA